MISSRLTRMSASAALRVLSTSALKPTACDVSAASNLAFLGSRPGSQSNSSATGKRCEPYENQQGQTTGVRRPRGLLPQGVDAPLERLAHVLPRLGHLLGNFWQNFGKMLLVFGCIGTDFCKKICVLQHFSKSTRLSS